MDIVIGLLVLSFFAAFGGTAIIAILAFVKAGRVEAELKRLLQSPERAAPARQVSREPEASKTCEVIRELAKVEDPVSPAAVLKPPVARQEKPAPVASSPEPVRDVPKTQASIGWEQWVGIRGAAALGGILLALAGLLFFKHAWDQGWATPILRVLTGTAVGLGALVLGEILRRRSFRFSPAAVSGGGIVVLYATTWAAFKLYEFIPALIALPLMGVVTAICAVVSVRLRSQLVAVLGLVGGFATPLLLSMPVDNPIGLFGYILLLDLGLLALGLRTKWPALGLLAMLGTFVVEMVWALRHLDAHFFPLAIASLGAFALVFVMAGQRSAGSERRRWLASQVGALLLPFVFAIYFAAITDFGAELWPLAALIAFLALGAGWVARVQNVSWLATGAATGALAVLATWLVRTGVSDGGLWEFTLCSLGLSLAFTVSDQFFGRTGSHEEGSRWERPFAPAIVSGGFAIMTVLAAVFYIETSPWPWLVAVLGQATILHWQGRAAKAGPLRIAGALLAGLALGLYLIDATSTSLGGVPSVGVSFAWMIGASAFFSGLALWSSRVDEEREANFAWLAASLFPLVLLALSPVRGAIIGELRTGALSLTVVLSALALLPAVVRGTGGVLLAAAALFVFKRLAWLSVFATHGARLGGDLIAPELAALTVLACVPIMARRFFERSQLAWASSGVLLLGALPVFNSLFASYLGSSDPWQAPAAIGTLALLIGVLTQVRLDSGCKARRAAASWLFGSAAVLLSYAVARGVGHEQKLVGLSLGGLALAALWRRWPSLGLKTCCAFMLSLSAAGIFSKVMLSVAGESHFVNGSWVIWNWTSYGTGLPALCVLGAAALLRAEGREIGSRFTTYLGLVAGFLTFVWLNLQVFLYFETEVSLRLNLDSLPARDLTLSIAWILYALGLLAVGMARQVSRLRQVSLVVLLLTLMKVFLHDLGGLEGLYRVGSLFGLAVSLLLVSLLYQRFVFPRIREAETE